MSYFISNKTRQQGIAQVFLTVLLVIVVGVAAALGGYYWQRHKINDLNQQVAVLNSKVSKQQNPQPVASSQATGSTATGNTYASQKGVKVVVYMPVKSAKVASPVGVVGEVPGNWSFEASFPIQLKDSSGKVVAQGTGQVLGDWMTDQLVPFSAKLTYTSVAPGTGTLVLQKDNPSGQASNDDSVNIPVQL